MGAPVTVVMPAEASRAKAEATDGYGATVILHGHEMADTFARMEEIQQRDGLTLLHPFADPVVIAGQGTVGLEILEDLPEVDVVVAASGGGGLLTGTAAALKRLRPGVRVYGVEPEHSNALALGLGGRVTRSRSPRHPSRTDWARRTPASGRSTWPGATWTRSSCSTRRPSRAACASPWSA